jgi:hypothetical protein
MAISITHQLDQQRAEAELHRGLAYNNDKCFDLNSRKSASELVNAFVAGGAGPRINDFAQPR